MKQIISQSTSAMSFFNFRYHNKKFLSFRTCEICMEKLRLYFEVYSGET